MIKFQCNYIKINTFFISLLIVGFIAVSTIPVNLSLQSTTVTVPFRFAVLFYSMFLIVYNLNKKQYRNLKKSDYFFIVFWLLYLLNVYFSFRNCTFSSETVAKEVEIYKRIIGICFVPSVAILMIDQKRIDYDAVFKIVYSVIFTILFVNVITGIDYDSQGRSSGFLSMYSISFGHVGVTLILMSVYYLMFKIKSNLYIWIGLLSGLLLGSFIMYASGTRSPLIACVVCVIYMFFIRKKYFQLVAFFSIFLLGISLLIFVNSPFTNESGSSFFSRLAKMVVSGDSSGRGKFYLESLRIFFDKPLFGGRFLFYDGLYPHNIFLEILMAMGLFGMLIFLLFFKNCVFFLFEFRNKYLENNDKVWVVVLWLQNFILALFSYGLYSNSVFWYFTAMTLVLNRETVNLENLNINKNN